MAIKETFKLFILTLIASLTLPASVLATSIETNCNENTTQTNPVINRSFLRFVSLNIAHGRGDGINQLLKKRSTFETSLTNVAELIRPLNPDLVALQEADAASRWSGDFHHVARLATAVEHSCYFYGSHATSFMYDYGTAILSQQYLQGAYSHAFEPSPPTTNKGYVAGKLWWNPDGRLPMPISITVASIHLDFSRAKVRKAQASEIVDNFVDVEGAIILMGDFNTDASEDDGVLRMLADRLELSIYRPDADDQGTFIKHGTRLDWILISRELRFRNYSVLPEVVSDHLAITADIELDHAD
jgi:endonuclease/exonuclease/phosphatase family metal-dependent hydrolase